MGHRSKVLIFIHAPFSPVCVQGWKTRMVYQVSLTGVVGWLDPSQGGSPVHSSADHWTPPRSIHPRITGLPPGWMDPPTLASAYTADHAQRQLLIYTDLGVISVSGNTLFTCTGSDPLGAGPTAILAATMGR